MTVLFADLVGSTQLVDRLDPEDVADIIAAYRAALREAAERFGGFIITYLGDGMLISFGFPAGHEEAPQQAVRAGLAIVAAVARLATDGSLPPGEALQVRVRISTGMVVVSVNAATVRLEDNLIGSTINLAARLQALAAPGDVVISQFTRRLTGDAFTYRAMGAHTLKGFEQPIEVSAVIAELGGQSRLSRRLGQMRTPMVNRLPELAALHARWALARGGALQVATLIADAGMGKSRLAHAAAEALAQEPHALLWMQCSAALGNTALHPHIDLVERMCGIAEDDEPPHKLDKLRTLLRAEGEGDETASVLAALLSIPASGDLPPLDMSGSLQKQRTFAALLRLLRKTCARQPVLLVYEDIHWMDPSSRDLAAQLAEELREAPLMVIATSRFGAPAPWAAAPHVTQLELVRLSAEHSAEVAAGATGVRLPPALLERIVAQTDGVPLFVEEMTRMAVEAADTVLATLPLPETLRDLLTERLDRLGPAKRLAQVGAVVGRVFPLALAATVAGVAAAALATAAARLLESGLLEQAEDGGALVFKHALVQDAAYASILARDRRSLHAGVAAGLIAGFADQVAAEPELVARHLASADMVTDAAGWWLRAAGQAIGRGGMAEAVAHLQSGLDGVARLPEGEPKQRAELSLLAMLGPVRMVLGGPGSPEFGAVQRRAVGLMQALPDRPAQFPVTYGLALFHWGRAELAEAGRLAQDLVATARFSPTAEHVMAGNTMLGMVHFHRGEPDASRSLLQASVALHEPERHAALYPRYMMDFGVFGRFYLTLASFACGDVRAALVQAGEAEPLAARLRQPHSRGFAMLAGFVLAALQRDAARALARAEACVAFATEQGFPEFIGMALAVRGWAMAQGGDPTAALAVLDRGVALWQMTGFENWQSWFTVLRSGVLLAAGRPSDALADIAAQERRIALNGERQFASLLLSAKAQAMAAEGADAASVHEAALSLAAAQGAAAWQVHAALPYAESLWRSGRAGMAHTLLAAAASALPPGTKPAEIMADWDRRCAAMPAAAPPRTDAA